MSRMIGSRRRVAWWTWALLAATVAALAPPGRVEAQSGVVRVHNRTGQPVEILVQHVDTWGARGWRVIAQIPPNGYQDFPGVPAGAVFGARSGARQWRPFPIVYRPGVPIFEYTLSPGS